MLDMYEHNKSDCIRLLNMIICEIPFIKSFTDDCLLERLLNLISIITNAFDTSSLSLNYREQDSENDRELAIREWLVGHYNAKCLIDDLNFSDAEDRARVAILVINILFKLRHSLKDIEQYLEDCDSFVQFDRQLNDFTRYDKLLELVANDSNRWKSEARYYKVKLDESKKLIDKYQQNEIFNYKINTRNQNLYKSRISLSNPLDDRPQSATNATNSVSVKKNMCDPISTNSQPNDVLLNGNYDDEDSDTDTNSVCNEDVNYVCVDCDKSYSTKFEFNLHMLRDHRHVDISDIIRNANTKIDIDMNESTKHMTNTCLQKCHKTQSKRYFKCFYRKCGKAFHKMHELKKHFARHQPKVERYVFVYSNQTNASLNQMRPHVLPKANRRQSSSAQTKAKTVKPSTMDTTAIITTTPITKANNNHKKKVNKTKDKIKTNVNNLKISNKINIDFGVTNASQTTIIDNNITNNLSDNSCRNSYATVPQTSDNENNVQTLSSKTSSAIAMQTTTTTSSHEFNGDNNNNNRVESFNNHYYSEQSNDGQNLDICPQQQEFCYGLQLTNAKTYPMINGLDSKSQL
ncbi:probable serine/threonine-protein kinase DDB_G0282963 [Oppia nitens]|uniref:probable serine/threonine-protein kinase DDB_G0282963 n=1 Tax=Oppia nitens TaxID=1686743 RepID=UPI0023DAD046|nr:probable serine/threonine-protein kinase DDB_G0282963 [Oppia nitens]